MPKIYFKTNDDQIVIMNETLVRVFGRLVKQFDLNADYKKCSLVNPRQIDLTIDQLASFKKFTKFHMLPSKFTTEDIKNLESILCQTPTDYMIGQLRQIKLVNNLLPAIDCTINDVPISSNKISTLVATDTLHAKITINDSLSTFEMNMYLDPVGNYEDYFKCFSAVAQSDHDGNLFHDLPFSSGSRTSYYSIFYESKINIYTISFDSRNFVTSQNSFPISYKKLLQVNIALLHKALHKFYILGHLKDTPKKIKN